MSCAAKTRADAQTHNTQPTWSHKLLGGDKSDNDNIKVID